MQLRAETTARRLKTRALRQNFQTFKSILNSGALFFLGLTHCLRLQIRPTLTTFIFLLISLQVFTAVF